MIYLTSHQTQAAYDAVKDSLPTPQVALVKENMTVNYKPYVPTPSHDYVDLGLPSGTLWATMNVGANSITDYGNYYQYGKGADTYQTTSGQDIYFGTEDPLATSADTASVVWGGNWHMPTQTQFKELTANTTYQWTTIDGINGGKFTAQNGNYVFFPAGGLYRYGDLKDKSYRGAYLCSSPAGPYDTISMEFYDNGDILIMINPRDSDGVSVRPVKDA